MAGSKGFPRSLGRAGLQSADGLAQLPTYTVATLPSASRNPRAMAYCSNGNAGAACVVVSNGSAWKVVALGSTASAT